MNPAESDYLQQFRGYLRGIKSWDDLDALFSRLRVDADAGWFIYAVGEAVPTKASDCGQVERFLEEVGTLLRREHEEDYCGIVYADDPAAPRLVKIYDPNNLGVSCGFSDNPPLPGWVLSLTPPVDLEVAFPPPGNRRRWWQKLFAQG